MVARSKCFLKMGELEKSLEDAEASLQGDPTFCKVTVWVGGLLLAFLSASTCSSLQWLKSQPDCLELIVVFFHRSLASAPVSQHLFSTQGSLHSTTPESGKALSVPLDLTSSRFRGFYKRPRPCTPWATLNLPWYSTIGATS